MCRMQEYFDQRNAANAPPLRVVDEDMTEARGVNQEGDRREHQTSLGEGTYVVSDIAARRRLRRLLRDEYDRLPEVARIHNEDPVRVHVHFWSSGPIRRLRPDRAVEIHIADNTLTLPFNPCVGEFLFGAEAYGIRRRFLANEAARARGELPMPTHPMSDEIDAGPSTAPAPSDAGAALPVSD